MSAVEIASGLDSVPVGSRDSFILNDVLDEDLSKDVFERVRTEVQWHQMSHKGGPVPRLICIEGEIDERGNIPLYRHPADELPPVERWTPTVLEIKRQIESKINQPLNHVLIQWYRSGVDYISPHADKTLDIHRGSFIINMSLGATRVMQIRPKKSTATSSTTTTTSASATEEEDSEEAMAILPPTTASATITTKPTKGPVHDRVVLSHNTAFLLGWQTNRDFMHGIKQDKRAATLKSDEELAYGGERISLTFRTVSTWVSSKGVVWGQGGRRKTEPSEDEIEEGRGCEERASATGSAGASASIGMEDEARRLVHAFSVENRTPGFDWEASYGDGFDVIHLSGIE